MILIFFIGQYLGYTKISSEYGPRISPTTGASSFHSGIDIPAPENTNLYAIYDCEIYFSGWALGGGYTISALTKYNSFKFSYCHIHPSFMPNVGQKFKKGDLIAKVGPKNIYNIKNNPYRDLDGNPTNGALTGTHLHFTLKNNNKTINPMNYFK